MTAEDHPRRPTRRTSREVPAPPVLADLDPDEPEPEVEEDETPATHTIHFVVEGFTALDRVFYSGQEMTVTEGTKEWDLVKDWIFWNKWKQQKVYGRQCWDQGPWQGMDYLDDPDLDDEQRAELMKVLATAKK